MQEDEGVPQGRTLAVVQERMFELVCSSEMYSALTLAVRPYSHIPMLQYIALKN